MEGHSQSARGIAVTHRWCRSGAIGTNAESDFVACHGNPVRNDGFLWKGPSRRIFQRPALGSRAQTQPKNQIQMKPRSFLALPHSFAVRIAPLLVCAQAHAAIVNVNESNSTHVWTLPSGTNLLNGATAFPPPETPNHGNSDQTSGTWTTVTNNTLGTAANKGESVAPNNNNTVTFPLDISVNTNGYNITQFDAYGAWPDSGRDNLDFRIQYSTVDAPTVFNNLADVSNHTSAPVNSTHTRITEDSTGVLATRVHSIKLVFGVPTGQENGWVGYREFIALGSAVPLASPLTWTGASGTGGNANWVSTADSNWKLTTGGGAANFSSLAPLTFDTTGANRNITLPAAVTAASVAFTNANTANYTFGGSALAVSNDLVSSGSGSATFANAVSATSGVTLSGGGGLVFGGALQGSGLNLSGAGSITLNAANPGLTGNAAVSNGVLNVGHNQSMEKASLLLNGGTANFKTAAPLVSDISGTGGTIVLGNTTGPVSSNLTIGHASSTVSTFGGAIVNASGATGRLTKTGSSSITLTGDNNYTGITTVQSGKLEFGKRLSFYHGVPASWPGKLVVEGGFVGFVTGGEGEFTESDLTALDLEGFSVATILGINATTGTTTTLSRNLTQPIDFNKSGMGTLKFTGTNSYSGFTDVVAGTLEAANPSGISIPGNVVLGDGGADVYLNMGASNQFGPESLVIMANLNGPVNSKMQMRGTNQTIAGLVSSGGNRVSLVQNDEIGTPGYTAPPGPATLTINTANESDNHLFAGIIRNQAGDPLSVVKNGPGTQTFQSVQAAAYSYSGPTTINGGRLILNVPNGQWIHSNTSVAAGATLEFTGTSNFVFYRAISGAGRVVKTGSNMVSLINQDGNAAASSFSGGAIVEGGILKFQSSGVSSGEGTGPGQTCPAGLMDPSNVIVAKNGGTIGIGGISPFGNSQVLPQFAPSVKIEEGGKLWGGDGSNIAFISNVHLDGGTVEITQGSVAGGFNTNITLVGTVVVGGTSTVPSTVTTTGTGATANVSLGSSGLPGTTFQVADVTGTSGVDFTVSSMLKNVGSDGGFASPLTKTGDGTMYLQGAKSYTGTTHVVAGELRLDTEFLSNTAAVRIDSQGFLNLLFSESDAIGQLTLDGVPMAVGVYGSMTNNTPGVIKTPRIRGTGTLNVTAGPSTDPYAAWASVIPNEADRGRVADPDGDGFTNLQEYLLGTSPTAHNGSLTQMERNSSGLVVRWCERVSGGTYTLQQSATLAENPWPTSALVPTNAADQSGLFSSDYVRKEAVIPVDSARKFVRVKASE